MEKVGRYKILEELGRGAMGVVYKAQDPTIGRLIAVKSIHLDTLADDSERVQMRERLLREAHSAGTLSHAGIVTIYDIFEENGFAFIFMEFVNGPTLEKFFVDKLAPDKTTMLSLLRQIAAALDFAHKKGIVHRDIKPANIMVHEDGTAKVADFGLAKILSQQRTQAGTIIGTPSYMSPEQVRGEGVAGPSDQFSLAVIAHEMLTGQKPFAGDTLHELMFKILQEDAVSPHRLNPTLTPSVEPVMRKAMAKNPAERYDTCTEFVTALATACSASLWVPMPPGAVNDLLTVGSVQAGPLEEAAVQAAADVAPTRPNEPEPLVEQAAIARVKQEVAPDDAVTNAIPIRRSPPPSAPSEAAKPVIAPPPVIEESPVILPVPARLPEKALPRSYASEAGDSTQGHGLRNGLIAAALILVAVGAYFLIPRNSGQGTESPAAVPAATNGTPATGPSALSSTPIAPAPTPDTSSSAKAPGAQTVPAAAVPVKPVAPKTPPLPTEATFQLTSTPPGTEATFDNSPSLRCVTPCSVNLTLARHTLLLKRDGYRDAQRVITLPGETELMVGMEALAGTLNLATTPPGLAVFVDGQEQPRKTPATFTLSVGPHRIQIVKGTDRQEMTVEIRDGVVIQRSVDWGQ